eukprot:217883-Rhodomonas_salina.2
MADETELGAGRFVLESPDNVEANAWNRTSGTDCAEKVRGVGHGRCGVQPHYVPIRHRKCLGRDIANA